MHVLGISLLKGNSQSIISAKSLGKVGDYMPLEGTFVGASGDGGNVFPTVEGVVSGKILGLAFDSNPCSRTCSITRCSEMVLARTDGTAGDYMSGVLVDTSGLVSKTGIHHVNGVIMGQLEDGIDGKSGETVKNCVLISINSILVADKIPPSNPKKTESK